MDCWLSHGFLWLKLSVSSSMLLVTYAQPRADSLEQWLSQISMQITRCTQRVILILASGKNSVPKPLTLSLLFRGFFQFFL